MGENDKFFELLAAQSAAGKTVKDGAAAIGCSERQAYRLAALPEFKHRVAELRTAAVDAAVGSLSAAASEAVATIRELLASTNDPSVRLNASKAILNALGPLSEIGELRSRLDALERGE